MSNTRWRHGIQIAILIVLIGAGVIGLELGSVWKRLGAEVQVIEYLDQITPGMDGEVCKQFQKLLTRQGLKFTLGAAVQSVEKGDRLTVNYKLRKDDSEHSLETDVVLVATGRKPYTEGLGLEDMGIELDPRGRIVVDDHFRTRLEGCYAIGDVIERHMVDIGFSSVASGVCTLVPQRSMPSRNVNAMGGLEFFG